MSAHAEVLALQQRLGLSYKDAAHHLFMVEFEKLKLDEKLYKSFANLKASIEKVMESSFNAVKDIEKSLESGGSGRTAGTGLNDKAGSLEEW